MNRLVSRDRICHAYSRSLGSFQAGLPTDDALLMMLLLDSAHVGQHASDQEVTTAPTANTSSELSRVQGPQKPKP